MENLVGLLPFALFIVACPLLMLFMMRGMHGGHAHGADHTAMPAQGSGDRACEHPSDAASEARLQAMEDEISGLRRALDEANRQRDRVRS